MKPDHEGVETLYDGSGDPYPAEVDRTELDSLTGELLVLLDKVRERMTGGEISRDTYEVVLRQFKAKCQDRIRQHNDTKPKSVCPDCEETRSPATWSSTGCGCIPF